MQLHQPCSATQSVIVPLSRKMGTIPVTVRLDPSRYDRLKRIVRRLSTTSQNVLQQALDTKLVSLERRRDITSQAEAQISLFEPIVRPERPASPKQEAFGFHRPEATIGHTYRSTVAMHRWLHQQSDMTGKSIQDIIHEALKAAGGPA